MVSQLLLSDNSLIRTLHLAVWNLWYDRSQIGIIVHTDEISHLLTLQLYLVLLQVSFEFRTFSLYSLLLLMDFFQYKNNLDKKINFNEKHTLENVWKRTLSLSPRRNSGIPERRTRILIVPTISLLSTEPEALTYDEFHIKFQQRECHATHIQKPQLHF